jgi:ribosomal RNA assembly protein
MFENGVKIPEERVAILIGKKGSIRREIEKRTSTKIIINSEENDVVVCSEDNLNVLTACSIIRAIGRGFNPKVALMLVNEDYGFEIIDITEFSGKSKKKLIRLKSRIIGSDGKAWKNIEKFTNTRISVYGKTVCLIGKIDNLLIARKSIEDLLKGAPHGRIYKWIIDKKKKENLV